MAPTNKPVVCQVSVSFGNEQRDCSARIDPDCWPSHAAPLELAGVLDLPKAEWKVLAAQERIILTLKSTGEPYRMIMDAGTGRFLARRL